MSTQNIFTIILIAVAFVLVVKFIPILWDCIKTATKWILRIAVGGVFVFFLLDFTVTKAEQVKPEETGDTIHAIMRYCTDKEFRQEFNSINWNKVIKPWLTESCEKNFGVSTDKLDENGQKLIDAGNRIYEVNKE